MLSKLVENAFLNPKKKKKKTLIENAQKELQVIKIMLKLLTF